jgi:hypothetical protein
MTQPPSSWPFERPEQLLDALNEQGLAPEESAEVLSAVQHLSAWQAPRPEPADTRRLLARLIPELPALSPVRQAIRERRRHRIAALLTTARAQVSLFGPGFWLVSALVTLLGAVIVLTKILPDQELILRASGPLLAYLGTVVAFRGSGRKTLELELVCLPSPFQLALARMVIVLGYDAGLGLALSLVLWLGGSGQVLALTLSWLMPLLLVAGLALLFSLRFSIQIAASLAYASWLVVLVVDPVSRLQLSQLALPLEILPGCLGLVLLTIALLCLRVNVQRLLPHA